MTKRLLSALILTVFLCNQTLSYAQSSDPSIPEDMEGQMSKILDSADQSQLQTMENEVNAEVASEKETTSPRHDRLVKRWTNRLTKVSEKTVERWTKIYGIKKP